MQWFVFLQDTNGSRRFVGAPYQFDDEAAAQMRVEEIQSAHNKPHKVDYWVVSAASEKTVRVEYYIEG